MTWTPPPSTFGALDPGKEYAGLAVFVAGQAVLAKKLVSPKPWPMSLLCLGQQALELVGPGLPLFVFEMPVLRHGAGKAHLGGDLLPLVGTCGAVASALRPVAIEDYEPGRWKGTIDGDVLVRRIKGTKTEPGKLTAAELVVLGSGDHNVVDAMGIGLWRLGRLHPNLR